MTCIPEAMIAIAADHSMMAGLLAWRRFPGKRRG
jgi:hypothetical protein